MIKRTHIKKEVITNANYELLAEIASTICNLTIDEIYTELEDTEDMLDNTTYLLLKISSYLDTTDIDDVCLRFIEIESIYNQRKQSHLDKIVGSMN